MTEKRSLISGVGVQVSGQLPAKKTTGLIGKETDERRTSNIERPTSNNVFCQLKKDSVSLLRRSNYEVRQRIYTSNLSVGGFCGPLSIKSAKRSVINIDNLVKSQNFQISIS